MDTEYLKKVGIFLVSAVLSVAILFYFGYHIWHSFTKEIETTAALEYSHTDTITSKGYIFRTETCLQSQGGKSLVSSVNEGEHVRKSGEVAKLYSEFAPETVARIAQIDEQIELLSRYSSGADSSLKDTANIDKEIFSVLSDMRDSSDKGNAGAAASLRQNLLAGVSERAVLTGGLSDLSDHIALLETEKASLRTSLGSLTGSVYTPVSGYYYSETDGYEDVFKAELLEDISFKELKELLMSPAGEKGTAGKTVTQSRWYLVCPIEESERNTYKAGKSCSVKFTASEITLSMDVEKVLYDKESAAVILSTNTMPDGFDYCRAQDVELEKAQYVGLKVPVAAVRLIDGVAGVYVLDVSRVSFRRVDILYTEENYYIVNMSDNAPQQNEQEEEETDENGEKTEGKKQKFIPYLKLHDIIIVEGKGLYEGRIIGD